MTIKRLDHISVVVDDLEGAIVFFTVLGMTVEGKAPVEGPWVDRINGIEGIKVDIVMMKTPAVAPPNALGLRSVIFAVEKIDDVVTPTLLHARAGGYHRLAG